VSIVVIVCHNKETPLSFFLCTFELLFGRSSHFASIRFQTPPFMQKKGGVENFLYILGFKSNRNQYIGIIFTGLYQNRAEKKSVSGRDRLWQVENNLLGRLRQRVLKREPPPLKTRQWGGEYALHSRQTLHSIIVPLGCTLERVHEIRSLPTWTLYKPSFCNRFFFFFFISIHKQYFQKT
jgi:hypothetical protein